MRSAGPRRARERKIIAATAAARGRGESTTRARLHPATPPRSGVLALVFTTYTFFSLKREPTGKDVGRPLVDKYGAMIKEGAMAFLKEEYKWLSVFVVLLGGILCALFSVEDQHTKLDGVLTTFAFFLGAILSASAGWLGMMVATDGNTRTTAACAGKEVKDSQGKVTGGTGSLNDGLRVAFKAGSVMGFVVVGLGLVGCAGCFCILAMHQGLGKTESLQILAGFGFGASSIALFARVAGGIYTKAADVGADLVGKVEAGIDEDDPHNPAVIADNVGDNVGDVAGMGADLFESYVGSIIAAATLAPRDCEVALPFWLAGAGVVASLVGTFAVSTKEKGKPVTTQEMSYGDAPGSGLSSAKEYAERAINEVPHLNCQFAKFCENFVKF